MARTVQQLFDLTGQVALVTGGSRGLGLQMAHALGEAGAKIMLSSRKAADLEEAAAELQAAGIDARWIAADCGKEEDIRRLATETMERMGPIDILVNNAGATWGAPAEEHPVAAWDKVMNLNVRGYFLLSQEVAKQSFIPRGKGRILNVASIAGLAGNPSAMKPSPTTPPKVRSSTSPAHWRASGASTASPSTPFAQAFSPAE
jgi:NAD(P)-dependent dehydrogenase (short-subunit alcohol dehydrogenase family)